MVKETMLDPAKLRACMDFFREDAGAAELRLEKELKAIAGPLEALQEQKRRIIDLYASGDLSRDGYVAKNRELDGMIETLNARNDELADNTALLRTTGAIDMAIAQYCEGTRWRKPAAVHAALCGESRSLQRQGLAARTGTGQYEQGDEMETNTLPFCIDSEITREERKQEKMLTAEALDYQQSVALLCDQSLGSISNAV
jgi:hypothetical protein